VFQFTSKNDFGPSYKGTEDMVTGNIGYSFKVPEYKETQLLISKIRQCPKFQILQNKLKFYHFLKKFFKRHAFV